jgi:threonyl-tRNA synthetase
MNSSVPGDLEVLRHSTAHVLAQAVLSLYPGAKYAIGPPIEEPPGFYYDFDIGRPFTPDDLEKIESRMLEIVKEDQPFRREEVSISEALELFKDQPYKREILEGIGEESQDQGVAGDKVSLYHNDSFVDLCRGPHISSTGEIRAFKLLSSAGAYWRGDESRQMLQRIYGTAWQDTGALEDYLNRVEEAQRRDHRKLGRELDLYSFPPELGSGLVLWHPKGAAMRNELVKHSETLHSERGYEWVSTPHIARGTLWETSGHLAKFSESMYPPMSLDEGHDYYLKPMNCPFHVFIYKSQTRSYRDLPMRLFELGTVYRLEKSGVLHGILRPRGFTQDDCHIFCREDQLVDEILGVMELILALYEPFGFSEPVIYLSTVNPEVAIGTPEMWERAEGALRKALDESGKPYEIAEGEGAFYGPKIDMNFRDAIGRLWQLTTVQCDFGLPERFELEYTGADNARHRPVMLHRALYGSIERFFGVLVEHYAGAFPVWLAPVQSLVIPIADRHAEYALDVASAVRAIGARAEVDASSETLNNRIRKAQEQKIPYMLVVGDKEVEARTVSVRSRSGEESRGVPLDEFTATLVADIEEKR